MNLWDKIVRFFKYIPHSFHRTKIRVVHEDDLKELISSLGISEDILDGKTRCTCCNESISFDNLWGILVKGESFLFICSNPDCLSEIY